MKLGPCVCAGVASVCAVLLVSLMACIAIGLTQLLQAALSAFLHLLATVGQIFIATIAAITSGFTISMTVVLAAIVSAMTFPPSHIEARVVVSVAVATSSIGASSLALFSMTSFQLETELAVSVVSTAAVAVAVAASWAVCVMSLVERETQHIGLQMTSLLHAVRKNQYNILRLLLRLPLGGTQEDANDALLYAIKVGHIECAEVLLSNGADQNTCDPYGNSALICACQSGSVRLVGKLLQAGAGVNGANTAGETALHCSAKYGFGRCVSELLRCGADPDPRDNLSRTPLLLAIKHAQEPADLVHMLIDAGSSVNSCMADGWTVLHQAAARGMCVSELLARGSSVNAQDTHGNTPLHLAAIHGHSHVITRLVTHGAECDTCNEPAMTPVHVAAGAGHVAVVSTLVRLGADPLRADDNGYTAICHSVQHSRERVTLYLLRHKYYSGTAHPRLANPLHIALNKADYQTARSLVLAGCEVMPARDRSLFRQREMQLDDAQAMHCSSLQQLLTQPWTLMDLCRVATRCQLRRPAADISHLPVPRSLQCYLDLEDLVYSTHLTELTDITDQIDGQPI